MTDSLPGTQSKAPSSERWSGLGRLLIAVYAILALAATGRSAVQITTKLSEAPVAYILSAVSAIVYIVATIALILHVRRGWRAVAWTTIVFEMAGVLIVGTLSLIEPQLFPHDTVWSVYGRGYIFVPLVIPVLGMVWLSARGRTGAQR